LIVPICDTGPAVEELIVIDPEGFSRCGHGTTGAAVRVLEEATPAGPGQQVNAVAKTIAETEGWSSRIALALPTRHSVQRLNGSGRNEPDHLALLFKR
jgi:hypothetical protein